MARFEIDLPNAQAFRQTTPRRRPQIDKGQGNDWRDIYMGVQTIRSLMPEAQTIYSLGQSLGLIDGTEDVAAKTPVSSAVREPVPGLIDSKATASDKSQFEQAQKQHAQARILRAQEQAAASRKSDAPLYRGPEASPHVAGFPTGEHPTERWARARYAMDSARTAQEVAAAMQQMKEADAAVRETNRIETLISEDQGRKVEAVADAMGRLNAAQTPEETAAAMRDYQGAIGHLTGAAYVASGAPQMPGTQAGAMMGQPTARLMEEMPAAPSQAVPFAPPQAEQDVAPRLTSAQAIAGIKAASASGDVNQYKKAIQAASTADISDMDPVNYSELLSPRKKRRRFMREISKMAQPRTMSLFEQEYKRSLMKNRAAQLEERKKDRLRKEGQSQWQEEVARLRIKVAQGNLTAREASNELGRKEYGRKMQLLKPQIRALQARASSAFASAARNWKIAKNNWDDPKYRKGINLNIGATEGHRLDRNIAALKGQIAGAKEAIELNEEFEVLTREKGKLKSLITKYGSIQKVKEEASKRNANSKKAKSLLKRYTEELEQLEGKRKTL